MGEMPIKVVCVKPLWPGDLQLLSGLQPKGTTDSTQDLLRSKEHQGDRALKNLCFKQLQNSLSNQ